MKTSPTPSMAQLRMRIAEKRIRQHRVAAKLDMSDGHLSHLLRESKPADDALRARISEAIEAVVAESVA